MYYLVWSSFLRIYEAWCLGLGVPSHPALLGVRVYIYVCIYGMSIVAGLGGLFMSGFLYGPVIPDEVAWLYRHTYGLVSFLFTLFHFIFEWRVLGGGHENEGHNLGLVLGISGQAAGHEDL
ncbi:hypothetical protein B0T24DRAFT_335164 [Lasiosphaeria ovina]|uniref:Uncharacterized protein n=1 Tax=Lasiosphaeria ovina TaxID=92902 RepID=A0AAE0N5N4_9PEZI|nr:hypothetical protein B0T24DRAFT_335164 [Lasiosphaeria ovina]